MGRFLLAITTMVCVTSIPTTRCSGVEVNTNRLRVFKMSIVQELWVRLVREFPFLQVIVYEKRFHYSNARPRGQLDLKVVVFLSFSVISNKSGLLIQNNRCDRVLPVWAWCVVDSKEISSPTICFITHLDSRQFN